VRDNISFIVESAVPAAMLAVLVNQLLANAEHSLAYAAA
jgi:ABC-type proline/glycine betaine transport system permease subunit